jgi:hypothetical protein
LNNLTIKISYWFWTADHTFRNCSTTLSAVIIVRQKVHDLAFTAILLSFIGCVSNISATAAVIVIRVSAGKNES